MQREKMSRVMREELAHIPCGDLSRNVLRATYNMQRRHDLASDPSAPKERSLRASIEDVRRPEPSFVAQYDGAYIGPSRRFSGRSRKAADAREGRLTKGSFLRRLERSR